MPGLVSPEPAMTSPFATDLDRNPANFTALTPLGFLDRTAAVYPDRLAVVHGERRYSWREAAERCRRLGSALAKRGIGKGDTVAIMAPNIPEMFEAHFGVPMTGAVLNALNIRLDAETIAFMLGHGGAKLLLSDREFSATIAKALALMTGAKPEVIDIDDVLAEGGDLIGAMTYEAFLASGDPTYRGVTIEDEWQAIALNYTSGTTGDPKGVVYHHRGAYLTAIGNQIVWGLGRHPACLWTLPMFHGNGWG